MEAALTASARLRLLERRARLSCRGFIYFQHSVRRAPSPAAANSAGLQQPVPISDQTTVLRPKACELETQGSQGGLLYGESLHSKGPGPSPLYFVCSPGSDCQNAAFRGKEAASSFCDIG